MNENPLCRLQSFGQSIWLDFIRRGMFRHGDLQRLIEEDGLSGVTANPSIFEKAIAESHDYDDAIRALALEERSVPDIYQTLAVEDMQRAADLFRPIYDRTQERDGYVSLEVSPYLAADTAGTIATAVAGSILGIDAFDQPNLQENEDSTNQLLQLVAEGSRWPEETPALIEGPLAYYSRYAAESGAELLSRFLGQRLPGDYIALLAYLTETAESDQALQAIRIQLRDRLKLATILGYGPRYLHSTGQFHKGGPHTGLFLQLIADALQDIAIPGRPYTFGALKRAQALGDLHALEKHGQRVLRIHLGADVRQGLAALTQTVETAFPRR